ATPLRPVSRPPVPLHETRAARTPRLYSVSATASAAARGSPARDRGRSGVPVYDSAGDVRNPSSPAQARDTVTTALPNTLAPSHVTVSGTSAAPPSSSTFLTLPATSSSACAVAGAAAGPADRIDA